MKSQKAILHFLIYPIVLFLSFYFGGFRNVIRILGYPLIVIILFMAIIVHFSESISI